MDRTFVRRGGAMFRAAVFALALAGALPAVASAGDLSGVVNLNTATVEQLTLLPGVGESRAHQIISMRKRQGAIRKVDDLLGVKGIGEASLAKMRPFVAVKGETTLAEK